MNDDDLFRVFNNFDYSTSHVSVMVDGQDITDYVTSLRFSFEDAQSDYELRYLGSVESRGNQ